MHANVRVDTRKGGPQPRVREHALGAEGGPNMLRRLTSVLCVAVHDHRDGIITRDLRRGRIADDLLRIAVEVDDLARVRTDGDLIRAHIRIALEVIARNGQPAGQRCF